MVEREPARVARSAGRRSGSPPRPGRRRGRARGRARTRSCRRPSSPESSTTSPPRNDGGQRLGDAPPSPPRCALVSSRMRHLPRRGAPTRSPPGSASTTSPAVMPFLAALAARRGRRRGRARRRRRSPRAGPRAAPAARPTTPASTSPVPPVAMPGLPAALTAARPPGLGDERALALEDDDRARRAGEGGGRLGPRAPAPPAVGRPTSRAISPGCGVRMVGAVAAERVERARAAAGAGRERVEAVRVHDQRHRARAHEAPAPARACAASWPSPGPSTTASRSPASASSALAGRPRRARRPPVAGSGSVIASGARRGHDRQAGLGRRDRHEPRARAQGAAGGQHRRARLADRAGHDEHVAEVALVGAARARRGNAAAASSSSSRKSDGAGRGQARCRDADVGDHQLARRGRTPAAARAPRFERREGDGDASRCAAGQSHGAAVRRHARGQVHRDDGHARLEPRAAGRRSPSAARPVGADAQAGAEHGVDDEVGLVDARRGPASSRPRPSTASDTAARALAGAAGARRASPGTASRRAEEERLARAPSRRATTKPSPPLLPRPHRTTTRRARGKRSPRPRAPPPRRRSPSAPAPGRPTSSIVRRSARRISSAVSTGITVGLYPRCADRAKSTAPDEEREGEAVDDERHVGPRRGRRRAAGGWRGSRRRRRPASPASDGPGVGASRGGGAAPSRAPRPSGDRQREQEAERAAAPRAGGRGRGPSLIVAPERDVPGTMASAWREADQQRVAQRDVARRRARGPARRSASHSTTPMRAIIGPRAPGERNTVSAHSSRSFPATRAGDGGEGEVEEEPAVGVGERPARRRGPRTPAPIIRTQSLPERDRHGGRACRGAGPRRRRGRCRASRGARAPRSGGPSC